MKFQEGDQVIVIATGEKGNVVEWINKKMLTIEVEGVQFPVYADQIDFPYFDAFSKKKEKVIKKKTEIEIPRKEKKIEKSIPLDGVHLAFFPILDKDVFDEDIFSHYRVYLLNHTEDHFNVSFQVFFQHEKELETRHDIPRLQEIYLFDLSFDQLNDQPKFQFEFSVEKLNPEEKRFIEVVFKPKPKQFLKLSEETIRAHNASFQFKLFENFNEQSAEKRPNESESQEIKSSNCGIDISILAKAGFKVNPKR